MLLLENHSVDIPDFLKRNPDGTFCYPDVVTAPAVFVPFVADLAAQAALAAAAASDLAVRTDILRQEALRLTLASQTRKEKDKAKRDAKREQQDKLHANKMAQRRVFAKNFKWSFE